MTQATTFRIQFPSSHIQQAIKTRQEEKIKLQRDRTITTTSFVLHLIDRYV